MNMTDNMKAFLDKATADSEMGQRFSKMNKAELMSAAQQLGITLTDADFDAAQQNQAMSDDEMSAVSGGGKCACVAEGGGTGGDNLKPCGCVMIGYGYFEDKAERCLCMWGGGGVDQ